MFKTSNEFSIFIETESAVTKKPVLDIILEYCEEHYLDVVDVVPMLNRSIRGKLENEFVANGMLPKVATLDV
jgi:hypothetical protein